jgi:Mn2+/Fe2+ NRAMP family transporter
MTAPTPPDLPTAGTPSGEPSPEPLPAEGPPPAPIPHSFAEYVRSMGPGIVVALTWLGAGDIVDSSVAGGHYGYSLMWALALALVIRWLFVSTIAKYQLCNQHRESLLEGLCRLQPLYAPFVLIASVVISHVTGIYMYQGLGDSVAGLVGWGPPWLWALAWAVASYLLLARKAFRTVELVFMGFLGLMTVSLLGAAAWVGPDFGGIAAGTVGFQAPAQHGQFDAMTIVVSLIGAVAGSLANLMYPYFIREKGWTTPAHRKVQLYDLGFGVLAMIVLDLAVWVLGAEVLHPQGLTIKATSDLPNLLSQVLGPLGGTLIYLGIFGAVATSVTGNGTGYSYLATDALLIWRRRRGETFTGDLRSHPAYRRMVVWVLFAPLPWVMSGKTSFVALTVAVNAFQVILLPVLAAGLWLITSGKRFIGAEYRNRAWEHALMAFLSALALFSAWEIIKKLLSTLTT